jgi:acyl-CoA hydrolase
MDSENSKTPAQSAVEARYVIMPDQANPYGTAFGGAIVAWIDMVASMAAQRHCGKEVVTAGIDSLNFREPIHIGEHVVLKACVNYAGRTSMEVGVQVSREDPYSGQSTVATTAHLTFVALNKDKRPAAVPRLVPETEEEKRRYTNAEMRVKNRKELLRKMR